MNPTVSIDWENYRLKYTVVPFVCCVFIYLFTVYYTVVHK
jgi:hypothetical protein